MPVQTQRPRSPTLTASSVLRGCQGPMITLRPVGCCWTARVLILRSLSLRAEDHHPWMRRVPSDVRKHGCPAAVDEPRSVRRPKTGGRPLALPRAMCIGYRDSSRGLGRRGGLGSGKVWGPDRLPVVVSRAALGATWVCCEFAWGYCLAIAWAVAMAETSKSKIAHGCLYRVRPG
eukprot:9477069-Pyramimonas_sp.AAC.1